MSGSIDFGWIFERWLSKEHFQAPLGGAPVLVRNIDLLESENGSGL